MDPGCVKSWKQALAVEPALRMHVVRPFEGGLQSQ